VSGAADAWRSGPVRVVLGAILVACAAAVGMFLLRTTDTGPKAGGRGPGRIDGVERPATEQGVAGPSGSSTSVPTARANSEVKVLVANGAGVRGLGAAATNALGNVGFATLTPTDATTTVERSAVQFVDGYEAEARAVAQSLTLPVAVVTRLISPPVAAAEVAGAHVVVVLGTDLSVSTAGTTTSGASNTPAVTRR